MVPKQAEAEEGMWDNHLDVVFVEEVKVQGLEKNVLILSNWGKGSQKV